jgi:glycosyltransferase involved in cell wall biosynthesis
MHLHKVMVIPNGINLAQFDPSQWQMEDLAELRTLLGIPPGARVVALVARLHPQKGHAYLIQAAPAILAACPDVVFLFVGEGEYRAAIEQQIQALDLCDHFRLVGLRSDVPRLLALSDVLVLPSVYEGMPNVILEAMAAGLPVVASDVDGVGEVLIDGVTGLLIPKADPVALGRAILVLLNDSSLSREMGRRGHERVRTQFSEQEMCRQYEALVRRHLEAGALPNQVASA